METPSKYKRVLLKVSGEMLAGDKDSGIDTKFVTWLCEEIKKVAQTGVEIAIVVGGGNYIRGVDFEGTGIERATADYMGMLSSVINGQALHDILNSVGQDSRIMSAIEMEEVAEPYIRRKGISHMDKGRVLVLAAGIGQPFFTTDTGAVTLALELGCDVMLKGTKVDGVYDSDPSTNSDAKKLENVSFQTAVEKPEIKIMDKAALGLAMEQGMPVKIFKLDEEDNFKEAVSSDSIGTLIK